MVNEYVSKRINLFEYQKKQNQSHEMYFLCFTFVVS